jgi:hypothetical protein
MNKSTPTAAGRKLSKAAMKQLMGGSTTINAWVCGAKRVTYYKRSECEKDCAKPDTCNKFTINPA